MGDLKNQPWRSDELAQQICDRFVVQNARQYPLLGIVYGVYRPVVHDHLARVLAPRKPKGRMR